VKTIEAERRQLSDTADEDSNRVLRQAVPSADGDTDTSGAEMPQLSSWGQMWWHPTWRNYGPPSETFCLCNSCLDEATTCGRINRYADVNLRKASRHLQTIYNLKYFKCTRDLFLVPNGQKQISEHCVNMAAAYKMGTKTEVVEKFL